MNDDEALNLVTLMTKEFDLIQKIKSADSPAIRDQLISELEITPVFSHPFHDRWIRINGAHTHAAWTEKGFEPALSDIPINIQILTATGYGIHDIENGGFHQFFTNGTGVFAPEMLRWFEDVGLDLTASIIRQAIAIFGEIFPRSHSERVGFLERYPTDSGGYRDPFKELNRPFYNSLSEKNEIYHEAADQWLKDTCGISDLRMSIEDARTFASHGPH